MGSVRPLKIHVRLYGVFRSVAKTGELDLNVTETTPTVKSVINELVSRQGSEALRQLILDGDNLDPRSNALIMVSGREIGTLEGLKTELRENDRLELLPVSHGG